MLADTAADLGEMSRIEALLAAIGPVEDARVIDIGCGEGQVARALATHGATVQGYDPFIKPTDWITEGAGVYRLSNAKAQALPEPDGAADVVLFVFSLHHVPKSAMGPALAEARRVLKPGGHLLVAEPLAEGPGQYVGELYHDETAVRRDALEALTAYAAPIFGHEQILRFAETRHFSDFDAYFAQAVSNMRFNGYSEDDVSNPEVRRRFDEVMSTTGGRFAQNVRINLFS
jgi:2-polyprenyl-3-methyl-5-hydroxy-6-metoxy-1,4-benzoquinol methylase